MSFPSSPSNGQLVVVNNITYQFDSSKQAWVRVLTGANLFTVNNLTVTGSLSGNLSGGNVYATGFYWANGQPFVSSVYSNTNVTAYLAGNVTTGNISTDGYYFANGAPFTTSNYGDANVAVYLAGNITTGNVSATAFYWANGTPFASSSYGNVDVSAYLPLYTGNLNPGNITASGNIVGGGVRNTSASTPPANPVVGDTWYDTENDVLLRYIDDGDSAQWVDITGVMVGTIGGGYKYTVSDTPPWNPIVGDNWYDTTTDILFRYVSDGVQSYWVDNSSIGIELPGQSFYGNTEVAAYLTGNIATGGITVSGNIIPATNNTINIGSTTSRFGSLFLSGNTIYLGGTVITEDTQLGTITFIPPATVGNPNPTAVIFTGNGGISAVETSSGSVTANTVTPSFANLTATSVYSNSYFYANGTAFVGGGGGLDNLDGGTPYSVYGGLTAIDGGGVT